MDITSITTLIGSYGFPIICCLYMMYSNNKTLESLKSTVSENTVATNNLVDIMKMVLNRPGQISTADKGDSLNV